MTIDELQEAALQNGCDIKLDRARGIATINKIAVESDTVELQLSKLEGLSIEELEKDYLPRPLGARL